MTFLSFKRLLDCENCSYSDRFQEKSFHLEKKKNHKNALHSRPTERATFNRLRASFTWVKNWRFSQSAILIPFVAFWKIRKNLYGNYITKCKITSENFIYLGFGFKRIQCFNSVMVTRVMPKIIFLEINSKLGSYEVHHELAHDIHIQILCMFIQLNYCLIFCSH